MVTHELLALVLAALLCALSGVDLVFAQNSAPNVSIPEFTLKFVGQPYEVQPTVSIDPYTGAKEDVPGYYVPNGTIQLSIKNQPIDSHSSFSLYYKVRIKGHFGEQWTEQTENIYVFSTENWASPLGIKPSDSEYTVLNYPADYPPNSQIDFQLAALLYNDTAVFYSDHPLAPSPFNQAGQYEIHPTLFSSTGWSNTQTVTVLETSPIESLSPGANQTHSLKVTVDSPRNQTYYSDELLVSVSASDPDVQTGPQYVAYILDGNPPVVFGEAPGMGMHSFTNSTIIKVPYGPHNLTGVGITWFNGADGVFYSQPVYFSVDNPNPAATPTQTPASSTPMATIEPSPTANGAQEDFAPYFTVAVLVIAAFVGLLMVLARRSGWRW